MYIELTQCNRAMMCDMSCFYILPVMVASYQTYIHCVAIY